MQQIYTLGIYFFSFLVKVYSFLDGKTKKLIDGHISTWEILENVDSEALVWFHVASLGEFEQGRPLIESLKSQYPNQKVLITFFSPSGYEIKKDYKYADLVLYLPFDTPENARRFLSKISIKVAVFIKYEFWFNYLNELQNNEIPIIYVSSLFRKGQLYFKINWMVGVFKKINHFFVQNEESRLILSSNGINNATVSGDTRLDSVVSTACQKWIEKKIENSLDGRPVVLFGSTWSGDHIHIVSFIKKHCSKYQYIIAPHEISPKEILKMNPKAIVLSPGPKTPNQAGICLDLIKLNKDIPVLGICLGHQSIGQAYGGLVVQADEIKHGKIDEIIHFGNILFEDINEIFEATRYHSLIIEKKSLPKDLEIIAETKNKIIMGIAHKNKKIFGLQFHPESIGTKNGKKILKNFLKIINYEF